MTRSRVSGTVALLVAGATLAAAPAAGGDGGFRTAEKGLALSGR